MALAALIRQRSALHDAALEAHGQRDRVFGQSQPWRGPVPARFELNTILFPKSANAWDSLADANRALGNSNKAKQLAEESHALGIERGLALMPLG